MSNRVLYGVLARRVLLPRLRPSSRNDEEYLFSSPENAERLMRVYNDAVAGRNMTRMSIEDFEAIAASRMNRR